ncbi:MAG: rod shape-determining protein MreD [Parvularculaceae bacterium]
MSRRTEGIATLSRAATPTILGLIGVILLAFPLRLAEGLAPTPLLPLVVVFFWTIYGPGLLPAASVFLIGLLQDFLSGGPLGLWPAVYLVTQYVVASQRGYFLGREQRVVWLGFVFAAAGAAFVLWMVMSLMTRTLLPLGGVFWQMAATIAVFPLFSAAFRQLHRRVLREA